MQQTNPEVDDFLSSATKWHAEMNFLREIILDCGLHEDFKWMHPCYSLNSKNVVLIHGFKEFVAISFFKGSLLKDTEGILTQPTKNSNEGRQIRFESIKDIETLIPTIKAYIFEAIEIEKLGLKVEKKKVSDFEMPTELQEKFEASPDFEKAFNALTPGRQKGYLLHFSQAKQPSTRVARIEKYTERILNGKGIRDCVCGHSKRMPNCDGSHKNYS